MGIVTVTSKLQTEISLAWTPLTSTATGNSLITSYNLYWDNASGVTNIEVIDSLVTAHTLTGLVGGQTYLFKVRAKNIYNYGDFSSEISVLASDVPD